VCGREGEDNARPGLSARWFMVPLWIQRWRKSNRPLFFVFPEMAQAAGDKTLVRQCNERINAYMERYKEISDATGIPMDTKRLALVRPENTTVPSSILKNNDKSAIFKKETPVFAGSKPIEWHWEKHKADFPGFTKESYLLRARYVMVAPLKDGVLEQITRSDGSISRYSFPDNMFLATTEDGNIRTFFRPKNGAEYWEYEHERNK